MISIQTGNFLQSHSTFAGDYFYEAIVCIVEYNQDGAIGFVVNRPFPHMLNELAEFAHLPPFPIWEGGPVDQDHLYFIHRRPDIIEGGKKIKPGIYYGGNFKQATEAIEHKIISDKDIYIFIGYCGWDAGDLEKETEQKEWSLAEEYFFV